MLPTCLGLVFAEAPGQALTPLAPSKSTSVADSDIVTNVGGSGLFFGEWLQVQLCLKHITQLMLVCQNPQYLDISVLTRTFDRCFDILVLNGIYQVSDRFC